VHMTHAGDVTTN